MQFSSVAQSCLTVSTPWTAAHQASLSITNSWSLLKLMSIESVMLSNHLILCHPLLPPSIFPSIRVVSNESVLCIRWPKYWSLSFRFSPSNEYLGLISFRIDWFDLLTVQDSQVSFPKPLLKSINSLVLSFLYGPTLTSIHDYWKNHSFDYMDLCWQNKEELKSLLMKMKEESEIAGLKPDFQKMKIMASSSFISWQVDVETMETVRTFFSWAPKSLQMVTAAMKLKDACSL